MKTTYFSENWYRIIRNIIYTLSILQSIWKDQMSCFISKSHVRQRKKHHFYSFIPFLFSNNISLNFHCAKNNLNGVICHSMKSTWCNIIIAQKFFRRIYCLMNKITSLSLFLEWNSTKIVRFLIKISLNMISTFMKIEFPTNFILMRKSN